MAPGVSPGTPGTPEARQPGSRRGRMLAESAAVEEVPVWLEVNGEPAVTWMCTPDQLEELATGWLHGEGYIETLDDLVKLRPCATDLGFWADVKPERVAAEGRRAEARARVRVRRRLDLPRGPAHREARACAGRAGRRRPAAGAVQGAVRPRRALQ